MSKAEVCEVKRWFTDSETQKRRRDWLVISVDEALHVRMADEIFRCRECHGRVRPHEASENQGAHFEHEQSHPGCSLSDAYVKGTPQSPHTRAIDF
jgi:hypothetical protein